MAYETPDYGGHERSTGAIDYKYSSDAATNAYGRFLSQQRGSRTLGDMTRGFQRAYPGQKAQFGARGLAGGGIRSGTMQNAMRNFVGDFSRQYGRQQQDNTQELQGYDMNQYNLDAWRQQSLADLEAQKANEVSNAARNLQYIRQIVGGL